MEAEAGTANSAWAVFSPTAAGAVGLGLAGRTAAAEKAGKAVSREVTLGATVDGARVVTSGLSRGDRVIVDGIQHIQPGVAIAATDVSTRISSTVAAQ